ncbi:hypothetical protein CMK13_02030, partial [Candidatus Poribacteria bacterium]
MQKYMSKTSKLWLVILLLSLSNSIVLAQVPPGGDGPGDSPVWSINPNKFEANASFVILVSIDGEDLPTSEDPDNPENPDPFSGGVLAAFVGDEIRGVQAELKFPPMFSGRPVFPIMLYTDTGGETVSFKWSPDGTEEKSIPLSDDQALEANGGLGSFAIPLELTGTQPPADGGTQPPADG